MTIELKGGNFTLSVIYIHSAEPVELQNALVEKIEQAPDFLQHAPVVVNISALSNPDWQQIEDVVTRTGLRIIGVSGVKDPQLKQLIALRGLPVLSEGHPPRPVTKAAGKSSAKSRIITSPVRSGQQIYARDGDLIVVNNVSAGAELIADGNIHIYGSLRGRALAGASGDDSCQIFCSNLAAELLSIAGKYWMTEQIPAALIGKSAHLCLVDGEFVIHTL